MAAEERRQGDQKRITNAVASRLKELSGDPRNLRNAAKAKDEELKREIRTNNRDDRKRAKEWARLSATFRSITGRQC